MRFLVMAALCLIVAGCSSDRGGLRQQRMQLPEIGNRAPESNALEESQGDAATGSDTAQEGSAQYFPGDGRFFTEPAIKIPTVTRSDNGVVLNFADTDIRVVIGAVLGDMLEIPFIIDPGVAGTISLQSSGEIVEESLLTSLESVLRLKNIALVDVNGTFHIVPMSEAPKRIAAIRQPMPESANLPGFGVQIVPLKFTSAIEMRKVLEPFAPPGGILQTDEARNMLILAGTSQELITMMQTIETFDVDWLKGMSFALFSPRFVEADVLADELLKIFGDANSPIAGIVRLIPITRINAILAISPQQHYLREVENWIKRLDIGGDTSGRKIYVYHIQNGRAVDIAGALNVMLGGEGGGNPLQLQREQRAVPAASTGFQLSGSSPAGQTGGGGQQPQRQPQARTSSAPEVFSAGGLKIVPNDENNSLLILASPTEYGVIENALKQIDISPRQVLIEAWLVEVSLTDELRFGLQWDFEFGDNNITLSRAGSGGISPEFPGFSYLYTGSANASFVLNALESVTDINVIASPKLMVLNNHTATLQVGDQVPVATQSAVSINDPNAPIVNSVQFRDTGVILTVTPRINEGGLVMLDITQELSEVARTTTSGIDSPTIQQRKITTTVAVQTGDTLALGGLIRETVTKSSSGVPILKDIPLLGYAFRTDDTSVRRTELIILISPRVIRDVTKTRDVMEYLRGEFRTLLPQDESEEETERP